MINPRRRWMLGAIAVLAVGIVVVVVAPKDGAREPSVGPLARLPLIGGFRIKEMSSKSKRCTVAMIDEVSEIHIFVVSDTEEFDGLLLIFDSSCPNPERNETFVDTAGKEWLLAVKNNSICGAKFVGKGVLCGIIFKEVERQTVEALLNGMEFRSYEK